MKEERRHVYIHHLSEDFMKITSYGNDDAYWRLAEKNLVSLLFLYLSRSMNAHTLRQLVQGLRELLEITQNADGLHRLVNELSEEHEDIKEIWAKDAMSILPDKWEEQEIFKRNMILAGVKRRLATLR